MVYLCVSGVSILGLVDKGLRHGIFYIFTIQEIVSILGLVDKGLRHIGASAYKFAYMEFQFFVLWKKDLN